MKIKYNFMEFDSQLEVDYYKHLKEQVYKGEVLDFFYHPNQIPNLVGKRSYTPDFMVLYRDRIEVVETKGYNPYSKMIDDAIHQAMLVKTSEWLREYVLETCNSHPQKFTKYGWYNTENVVYKKIKYLKAYGFVEWDFKNPNTIANKRKEKISEQKDEIKDLKEFKKNAERFFNYWSKIQHNEKLTKAQREWFDKYVLEHREE
jgi:hypothetical protein